MPKVEWYKIVSTHWHHLSHRAYTNTNELTSKKTGSGGKASYDKSLNDLRNEVATNYKGDAIPIIKCTWFKFAPLWDNNDCIVGDGYQDKYPLYSDGVKHDDFFINV